jgi:hypothetical protein
MKNRLHGFILYLPDFGSNCLVKNSTRAAIYPIKARVKLH